MISIEHPNNHKIPENSPVEVFSTGLANRFANNFLIIIIIIISMIIRMNISLLTLIQKQQPRFVSMSQQLEENQGIWYQKVYNSKLIKSFSEFIRVY